MKQNLIQSAAVARRGRPRVRWPITAISPFLAWMVLLAEAGPAQAVPPVNPRVRPAPRTRAPLPKAFRLLGAKCPRGVTRVLPTRHHGFGQRLVCGPGGRVVAVFGSAYQLRLAHQQGVLYRLKPRTRRQPSLTVGHIGRAIWIRKISCGACRRILGFTAMIRLDRLSPTQRLAFNRILGLPAKLRLLTPKQVQRALYRGRIPPRP
jgi:hypothetical protein